MFQLRFRASELLYVREGRQALVDDLIQWIVTSQLELSINPLLLLLGGYHSTLKRDLTFY